MEGLHENSGGDLIFFIYFMLCLLEVKPKGELLKSDVMWVTVPPYRVLKTCTY